MSKIWLCGITCAGKEHHLRELIDPVKECFTGLQWNFHYPMDDGSVYLEQNRKDGRIVYSHFSGRHGFSQTQYLWQGTMEEGDWFIQVDDQERIGVEFCRDILPDLIKGCEVKNIGMVANYGKGLLFRYHDELRFEGSPHWFAQNISGIAINIELDKKHFWHVRDRERGPFQFIDHYGKYYIEYPAGSNHCLLGLEKNGNPQELFPVRENHRLEFRKYLRELEIPLKVDSVIEYFVSNQFTLTAKMKDFINNEKIINDMFRYHVLGDRTIVDNHDFKDMVRI